MPFDLVPEDMEGYWQVPDQSVRIVLFSPSGRKGTGNAVILHKMVGKETHHLTPEASHVLITHITAGDRDHFLTHLGF